MWIVKIALSRPYTFIVLAILILIAAPVVIMSTPTDIFPNINIPGGVDRLAVHGAKSRGARRATDDSV